MVLPASTSHPECTRVFDIRTMIHHPDSSRVTDAYFSKSIKAFVKDRPEDNEKNKGKNLIIFAIYGDLHLKTNDQDCIVFGRDFHMTRGNREPVKIYVICLKHEREFAFELVNDHDEPKIGFLKYSRRSGLIEVFDLSEENHRHQPQPVNPIRQFFSWMHRWVSGSPS